MRHERFVDLATAGVCVPRVKPSHGNRAHALRNAGPGWIRVRRSLSDKHTGDDPGCGRARSALSEHSRTALSGYPVPASQDPPRAKTGIGLACDGSDRVVTATPVKTLCSPH